MKLLGVVILFTCMFAATFSDLLIVASYKINQQYISKTLCVNKDNAIMHCNGRCYLNKQLATTEKPSSPLNTKSSERFEIQFFLIALPSSLLQNFNQKNTFTNKPQSFTAQSFIRLNLRPPIA